MWNFIISPQLSCKIHLIRYRNGATNDNCNLFMKSVWFYQLLQKKFKFVRVPYQHPRTDKDRYDSYLGILMDFSLGFDKHVDNQKGCHNLLTDTFIFSSKESRHSQNSILHLRETHSPILLSGMEFHTMNASRGDLPRPTLHGFSSLHEKTQIT